MPKFLIFWILILHADGIFGQSQATAFERLMTLSEFKKVITVDTVAGKTNVLLASKSENPKFVFVFALGGEGTLAVHADSDGIPRTKRGENAASWFAFGFVQEQATWAAIDVPEMFGIGVTREQRQEARHIDAIAQVAGRLRQEYPESKHILIGHSNGGITAGMQAIQAKRAFDGIVFSAPALNHFPVGWKPEQAKTPIMFIVHEHDQCGGSGRRLPINALTVNAAGNNYPLVVIKKPTLGERTACRGVLGPHFFSGAELEYAEAIMKWARSLK